MSYDNICITFDNICIAFILLILCAIICMLVLPVMNFYIPSICAALIICAVIGMLVVLPRIKANELYIIIEYDNFYTDYNKAISKRKFQKHALGVFMINRVLKIEASSGLKYKLLRRPSQLTADERALKRALIIINKHLPLGKSALIDCQHELIDAGLEKFARL